MEQWKPVNVPGCSGRYEVSDHGNVRNRATKRLLKFSRNPNGALTVEFMPYGCVRNCKYQVHRLVMSAFTDIPYGSDLYVRHKDDDLSNNHLSNLVWQPNKKHPYTKLTEQDVRSIRQRRARNEPYKSIARDYHISIATAHNVATGQEWKNVS